MPISSRFLYFGTISLLLVGSLISFYSTEITNFLFELLFFISGILALKQMPNLGLKKLVYVACVLFYILISLFIALGFNESHIYDFLLAYKFCVYLIFLLIFSSVPRFDFHSILLIRNLFLFVFLVIYALKFLMGNYRPFVFIENNFEIMLLCLIFYASHIANLNTSTSAILGLLVVAFLSGSRSGVVLIMLTSLFTFNFRKIRERGNLFIVICLIMLSGWVTYLVFMSRIEGGNFEEIDRYKFAQYFLYSVEEWPWWKFLTGSLRISELPTAVCNELSFYSGLFSFKKNYTCYSVILHAFNLRVLYDHGILLIVFLLFAILKILSRLSKVEAYFIVILIFLNGLSVSSLNSVFTVIGIMFISTLIKKNLEG